MLHKVNTAFYGMDKISWYIFMTDTSLYSIPMVNNNRCMQHNDMYGYEDCIYGRQSDLKY